MAFAGKTVEEVKFAGKEMGDVALAGRMVAEVAFAEVGYGAALDVAFEVLFEVAMYEPVQLAYMLSH